MDFSGVIDKIMAEARSGSDEPLIVYRDKDGEWHGDFTQNQYGETFGWVESANEQDPFAVTFKASEYTGGSYPFVYDKILAARLFAEYHTLEPGAGNLDELRALADFLEKNIGELSSEATEYIAQFDNPLAELHKMIPENLTIGHPDEYHGADNAWKAFEIIEDRIDALIKRSAKAEIAAASVPQKRNIEGYEEITSIQLAGRVVVLAENPKAAEPYLVCNIKWDNPLGMEERYDAAATDNYLEAIGEFIHRQNVLLGELRDERTPGFPFQKLTAADCIPFGSDTDLNGKAIVIKPEALAPEYRTAEIQLKIVLGGFGASPDSRGSAVFCKDLYSGKESRFERQDVLGLADMERLPEWAKAKLTVMEALKEPGVFEYGGYHFKPVRNFRKGEVTRRLAGDSRPWKTDAQYEMRNMSSDRELGLSKHEWKKTDYSHEGFYAASGNSGADIFKCIENGKLYVPHENELYRYNEPQQTKKPSLLGKLDDNKQIVERGKAANKDKPVTQKPGDLEVD
jgi:hypothetical protein